MEKLKVLKDLYGDEEDAAGIIEREQLRSAAIAWIKEFMNQDCTSCLLRDDAKLEGCEHDHNLTIFGDEKQGVKKWIKHFFSITSKDLEK